MTILTSSETVKAPGAFAAACLNEHLNQLDGPDNQVRIDVQLPPAGLEKRAGIAPERRVVAWISQAKHVSANGSVGRAIAITWEAKNGAPAPTFSGSLAVVNSARSEESVLVISGSYRSPDGIAGDDFAGALDAVIARASAAAFLEQLRDRIEWDYSETQLTAGTPAQRAIEGVEGPSGRRRTRLRVENPVHGHRILLVEDEASLVDVVRAYLEAENFVVDRAPDGEAALELAAQSSYDLVLLDLNLPKLSGIEVFKRLREHSVIPVIMVTTRGEEIDRVVGLELGADDYLAKPFSPRELVARVKTVLRRTSAPASPDPGREVQRVNDLEIDRPGHEVRRAGQKVAVTPMEFRILDVLAQNQGRVLTRAQLLDMTTEEGSDIFDRTLDRHIANLRRKIEDDPIKPRFIETVAGVGYKLRS
jgi:DNA-binding response OmpR family regulator